MQKENRAAWIRHIFFTLTEHGAVRGLDALTTLVLIRVMTVTHFGLFSVYQSWVGFLFLALPSLELALYRRYGELKASGALTAELSTYRVFNYLKLAVAACFVLLLSLLPQQAPWPVRASILAFALALPLSHALFGFLREPLRFEMRQHLVALLSALQRLALLVALVAVAWTAPGNIIALCLAGLASYALFGIIWSAASRKVVAPGGRSSLREALGKIPPILTTTVLWIHFNGVISQAIQTLDMLALNSFQTPLEEIALYGISLKAANFFQILPVALVNSFGVYLGRIKANDRAAERRLVARYTLAFCVLCVALFAFGLVVAEPLLVFLAKGKLDVAAIPRIVGYFKYQLAGVLLLCASYPLSTYLGARAGLREMFIQVFVPWLALSLGAYFWAAGHGGPLLTAQANVAVYGILAVLLARFYLKTRSA